MRRPTVTPERLTRTTLVAALAVLVVAVASLVSAWRPGGGAEASSLAAGLPRVRVGADTGGAGGPLIEPPAVRGLPRAAPVRVTVPSLDIASDLVDLRLSSDGSLQVPQDYSQAGWFVDGPFPGKANGPPAVIVGHVDSETGPAVFFPLARVEKGARIRVDRSDGSAAVFRVVEAKQYPKDRLPARQLYARRQPSELVLITCTGTFDEQTGSYLDNFVVTARLDRKASLGTA